MSMLDDAEVVEAPHVGAGDTCDICGKSGFRNLGSHKRSAHGVESSGRPSRQRKDSQPKASRSSSKAAGSLYEELVTAYSVIFQLWAMKDPVCGGAALQQAPAIARAWDDAQKQSPAVREVLEKMLGASIWMGVLVAHAPIGMTVLAHHGPQRHLYFPQASEGAADGPGEPSPPPPGPDAAQVVSEAYGVYAPGSADAAR